MKQFLLITLFLMVASSSFSQTNSVDLKTAAGTPISQHSSIQEAYNAITPTITQAYLIEINAIYTGANETYPITFSNRSGSSAPNTITLRPAAGNTGELVTGSSTTGILTLNDADFVIIDGRPGGTGTTPDLRIQNSITTGTASSTIVFVNGASNCIVRYAHLQNNTQNASGPRTLEFTTAGGTGNSNNTVHNCKVEGGRSGIGFDGTVGIPNDNNTIRSCEIFNFGYAGIWIFSNASNVTIDSCLIYQTAGINNTLNTGINIGGSASGIINIRKNKIYDIQSTSTSTGNAIRGIWFQTSGVAGATYNIENNFIALPLNNANTQNVHGIDINGANAFNVNCYYNTVRIGGTQTGGTGMVSSGIRQNSAGAIANARNNILINKRNGGSGIHTGAAYISTTTLTADYNCYFADGSGAFHSMWLGTGYNVLGDYKTAATPNETNSLFKDVNFVSATDLHLAGASIGDNQLRAAPIVTVLTDIDGQVRNAVNPYKGADEGNVILAVTQQNSIAETYSLSQNYPNPFNPSTSINFNIPHKGFTSLKIYDMSGKEVASLIGKDLSAGNYNVDLDGSKLSSGVYFYTLNVNEFTDTKKMILIK